MKPNQSAPRREQDRGSADMNNYDSDVEGGQRNGVGSRRRSVKRGFWIACMLSEMEVINTISSYHFVITVCKVLF